MLTKRIWDKEYKLVIERDEYSESPREWDNLWTLLTMHRKYDLWDEPFDSHWNSMEEDFAIFINKEFKILERESDYSLSEKESTKIWQYIEKHILYQLVSMTDHSWISLNIWHSHDRWDYWYVWYIFAHKDKIKENFGIWKVSQKYKDKTYEIFKWEIETMNQYLNWEVYEFIIEEQDIITKDWKEYYSWWEHYDSCWGFCSFKEASEYINHDIFTEEEILNYNID